MTSNALENMSKENFLPIRKLADKKNDFTLSKVKNVKDKDMFAMPLVIEKRRPLRATENIIKNVTNNNIKNNLKAENLKNNKDNEPYKVKSNVITTTRIAASKKLSLNGKKSTQSKINKMDSKIDTKMPKITMAKKNPLSTTGRKVLSTKAVKKFKSSHKKVIEIIKPDTEDLSSNTADEYIDALSSLNHDPIFQEKNQNINVFPSIISPIKSFSSLTLKDIVDIDGKDLHDEYQCSAYAKDIYEYLYQIEKISPTSNQILSPSITIHMRLILIDWLIQIHQHYKLLPETLYLTVSIIDRYLQACESVHKKTLQLVGVTAMFIACKFEELYIMEVRDFVHVTKNTYTIEDIISMEICILKALDFSFSKPYAIQFLRRFSKITSSLCHHTVAKFFLEMSLLDYNLSNAYPSILAASALCLSMNMLGDLTWDHTMEYYSQYKETQLISTMQSLLRLYKKAVKSDSYKSVISKYSSPKLLNVPKLVTESLKGSETGWINEICLP